MRKAVEWLRDEFEQRKVANPRYSLRAFSRKIGVSVGHVSDIFTGRRTLTPETLARIRLALGSEPPVSEVQRGHFLTPLPLQLPREFHGQESVERFVAQALTRPLMACRLALFGLPGMGKSSLAAHLCRGRKLRSLFPGGVLWLTFGPDADTEALAVEACRALGVSARDDARLAALRRRLADERVLLVFDDVRSEDLLAEMLIGGPSCCTLLTTRFPEIATSFAGPDAIQVRELDPRAARAVFLANAGELEASEESERFLTLSHGVPAILSLGGLYVRRKARGGNPRQLRQAFVALNEVLDNGARETVLQRLPGMHEMEVSLVSLLDPLFRLLSEDGKRALAALPWFPVAPASFSESFFVEAAGVPLAALDELNELGLVELGEDGRCELPALVRHGARLFSPAGEDFARNFLKACEGFARSLPEGFHARSLECACLEMGLEQALAHGAWSACATLLNAVGDTLLLTGKHERLGHWLERMPRLPLPSDLAMRADFFQARLDLAAGRAPAAHAAVQRIGAEVDCLLRVQVLCLAFAISMEVRDWGMFDDSLDEARDLLHRRQAECAAAVPELLFAWGQRLGRRGNPKGGKRFLQRSLWHAERGGLTHLALRCCQELAMAHAFAGEPEEELAILRKGLRLAESHSPALGFISCFLGAAEARIGRIRTAHEHLTRALLVVRDLDDVVTETYVHHYLGPVARALGQPEQHRSSTERSLELARKTRMDVAEAWALNDLARLEFEQGNEARALELSDEAFAIGERRKEPYVVLSCLIPRIQLFLRCGDFLGARAMVGKALDIVCDERFRSYRSPVLREAGELELATGNISEAEEKALLAEQASCGNPNHVAAARWLLARCEEKTGRKAAARELVERVLPYFEGEDVEAVKAFQEFLRGMRRNVAWEGEKNPWDLDKVK